MKYYTLLIATLFLFSCGKKKTIQLPEIDHSGITEINDVSVAYLFYDETLKDSVTLNKSNLISTTNWLINVDKRLKLKQAIPLIKSLQEKKSSSSHKNESAKNYFTCFDPSTKNLRFIEFTDVVYLKKGISNMNSDQNKYLMIDIETMDDIKISSFIEKVNRANTNIHEFINVTKFATNGHTETINLILCFDENLSFQNYISIKSMVSKLEVENLNISKDEFISN